MNEVVVESANQENSGDAAVQPSSSGQLLRQAREQRQMTVQTLAVMLKVPVHKLQALEEDRWESLTDAVFTRSLALSVCRILRVPVEPVLAGLPRLEGSKLSTNPEGLNAPFKDKTLRSLMSSSQGESSGNAVKIVAVLLIAVCGSAGLYFLPQWQSSEEQAVAEATESVAEPELMFAPLSLPEVVQFESSAPTPAATVPAEGSPVAEAPESMAAVVQEPVVAVQETVASAQPGVPVAVEPVLAEGEPVPVPADRVQEGPRLRFVASGESWVQVRDAEGKVLIEKFLKAGDVYEGTVSSRPLKVVVGNATATTLEVDGAAFNVKDSSRNNVARFEVK